MCDCKAIDPACFHGSLLEALTRLRAWGAPLVAFGQTALWDEPTKAVLTRALRDCAPELRMIAGIHDADFFSKHPGRAAETDRPFAVLARDDHSHRELWAAIGELSSLLGSETPPHLDDLRRAVPLERLAAAAEEGRDAFYDRVSEAWGWRGLAYTGDDRPIGADVAARDLLPGLRRLVTWGMEESLRLLSEGACRNTAAQARRLEEWIEEEARALGEEGTVSALYQGLLRRIYEALLGGPADQLAVSSTVEYFRFDAETAALPRFRLLDQFLHPETRQLCEDAYNESVRGSGAYELAEFGEGAIPFDLVVPGRGRATIRVLPRMVIVDLEHGPIRVRTPQPVQNMRDLLQALALPDSPAIVGKALLLPLMFAAEAVMVLNQGGSVYVDRTERFAQRIAAAGVPIAAYPLLRLHYHSLNALSAVQATFELPAHLAAAFGRPRVTAAEFAAEWEGVVERQEGVLRELTAARSETETMGLLAVHDGEGWPDRLAQHQEARAGLRRLGEDAARLNRRLAELRNQRRSLCAQAEELERASGQLRRELMQDSPAEEAGPRRREVQQRLAACRLEYAACRRERTELIAQIARISRGAEVQALRRSLAAITREIDQARLRLARNALLCRGLRTADHRPAGWWFLLLQDCGDWFERTLHTAEAYFEPFVPAGRLPHENDPQP